MWSDRNPQLVDHTDILQFLASHFASHFSKAPATDDTVISERGEFNERAS